LIRLALFGSPVKASLSPRIHEQFAAQFALEIDYQSIEATADEFPAKLEKFKRSGGIGCNITLPLKRLAWQLSSSASAQVSQAQAANTLVSEPSGWYAETTDGAGLIADLTGNHGVVLAGNRVLIFGAGGATAGILGQLLAHEPAEILLLNRNLERAQVLAKRFKSSGNINALALQDLPSLDLEKEGQFDLVINATSLGHQGQTPPLTRELFAPGALCYDLNYGKASLPLKELCGELDQNYVDGLGMLVEQAAKSFQIWTGKEPESEAVIALCRQDLLPHL
jgi:shikimate dehydrogenase